MHKTPLDTWIPSALHLDLSKACHGVEEPHSSPLNVYPSIADATPLPYNTQSCNAVDDLDNTGEAELLGTTQTHDVGGSSHAYDDVQAYMDGRLDIDASRDVCEEFIDNDGLMDNPEVLDNKEACPNTVPILEWFTSNIWDNINDPSPSLDIGHLTS
nr:hypothetical protein CFP56_73629 [Quercus suber]